MRLKRAKRARKIVSFFRSAHGFKPPFDVLLDGTAIQASINHGVTLAEALPKLLGGRCHLLVPRAIVAELHVLGRKFAAAAKIARRLKVVDGNDMSSSSSASNALLALVADGNARRRFVMTEDPELREQLAALRVVPLLRFARSQIILELPGGRAQAQVQAAPSAAPTASPEPGAATSANSGFGGQGGGAAESSAKKRKRFKEPNPLSCKKKQRKLTPSPNERQRAGASSVDGEAEGAGARKRMRRGRR